MARLLIIDDDPSILLMLQAILEAEGFDTALAGDGNTALRRMDEERPDLILLDVMMPVMDGWAVLERIRERRHPPRVIILTAKSSASDAVRAYSLGASAYVTKPFDIDDLTRTIRSVLSRSPEEETRYREVMLATLTS